MLPQRHGATPDRPPIRLSERAAGRIVELLRTEPGGTQFRVSVNGGGCSGFMYAFDLDPLVTEDDEVLTDRGISFLVDRVSLPYLLGSTVDYTEELIGSRFQIDNPNATASCGCGVSFAV